MNEVAAKGAEIDVRLHNGSVAWGHIESEYEDVVEDILKTLVPEEPYAYTISPMPTADGSIPHQRFVSTMADLRKSYEDLHRVSLVRKMQAVAEIRGDWYAFVYGLGEGLIKSTGQIVHTPTAVLFPTMGKQGITGELFWRRSATGAPFTGGRDGPLAAETAILNRHETYLEAVRKRDVRAITSLFHPAAQVGVRDHVNDTGTLADLHNAEELLRYLTSFHTRFRVLEVSSVQRLVTDWFVFAELLWIVEDINDAGKRKKFYTAEHAEVRPDGLFASLIGHGTERSPA